jgi:hypothetical protein
MAVAVGAKKHQSKANLMLLDSHLDSQRHQLQGALTGLGGRPWRFVMSDASGSASFPLQ